MAKKSSKKEVVTDSIIPENPALLEPVPQGGGRKKRLAESIVARKRRAKKRLIPTQYVGREEREKSLKRRRWGKRSSRI